MRGDSLKPTAETELWRLRGTEVRVLGLDTCVALAGERRVDVTVWSEIIT